MWKVIIFYMAISFISIYLLHQIWLYMVDTYSDKKVNRIIENQVSQYKEIIENLSNNSTSYEEDDTMSQDLETFLNTISNS
jgi:uncharacterized membrane-anchored protein YitT (DUF2179 family)